MTERKNSRSMMNPEGNAGGIPKDMPVVNMTKEKVGQMLDYSASSTRGFSVPLFYDPNLETNEEALTE